MSRRYGFTLIELLVALVTLGIIAAATVGLLHRTQQVSNAQTAQADLQSAVRAGATILPNELRELDGTDIVALGPDSITYRAMRGFAVTCAVAPGQLLLNAAPGWGHAWRAPQPGRDSLLVFVEGNPATGADDRWIALPLASTGAARCGADPAVALGTPVDTASVAAGGPVRIFEVMQIKIYRQGGAWWLGARSVTANETLQPVLGPLTAEGLALTALDSAGAPAARIADARSIGLAFRGLTSPVHRAGRIVSIQDSTLALVRLRNAPWP